MMRIRSLSVISGMFIAFVSTQAFGGNCYVDGLGGFSSPIVTDSSHGFSNGTLCGHSIYGVNGCVVNVTIGQSSSTGGDCLSLGQGVTLEMNNKNITCSSGYSCGTAIKVTNNGSGSNRVTINGGVTTGPWPYGSNIAGDWTNGVNVTGGSSSYVTVTRMKIDLQGSGDNGIVGAGTVRTSVVYGGTGTCIDAGPGTIYDSVVHDCDLGIAAITSGYVHTTIDHCYLHDNAFATQSSINGASPIVVKDSTFAVNDCNFQNQYGNCDLANPFGANIDFTGVNFLDDLVVE